MEGDVLSGENRDAFGRRSRPAKRSFVIFSVIVAVLIAQITWWIYYQIHQNKLVYQLHQSALVIRVRSALHEIHRSYESRLIQFTESVRRGHPGAEIGLAGDEIPPPLRKDQFSSFFCHGDSIYYKDPTGIVIRSAIDWPQLTAWMADKYPDLVVERLPQTRVDPYQYGPDRSLRLPLIVRPKTQLVAELTDRTDRKTIMFISEGAFFTLMVMVGIYVMYATLKKDLALESQQKNFILSITHELKSPLASIKLYVQTLLGKDVPPEKMNSFLRHSLQDVERLERLVENVLEAARLDRDDYTYSMSPVGLSDVVGRCLQRISYYAEDDRIELVTDVEKGVSIRGDEHALVSVFDNLIENAVKYSNPPKKISVRLKSEPSGPVFEIRDNGIGIPPADLPHVYDRFYRSGHEMTRTAKGTGIGLWIVKKVVERHGGRISVRSDGVDQGTSVIVSFPAINKA